MVVTSRLRCNGVRKVGSIGLPRRQRRVSCRAEKETTKPKPEEAKATEPDRTGDSAFSEEELARLAALKAQKSSGDSEGGMIQGALSEINLIDWPAPGKAAVETLYVLLIVVGATAFLFGLNGVFTEVANKLY